MLDELVPLIERLGATWLLQWAVLESALVPASRGSGTSRPHGWTGPWS